VLRRAKLRRWLVRRRRVPQLLLLEELLLLLLLRWRAHTYVMNAPRSGREHGTAQSSQSTA